MHRLIRPFLVSMGMPWILAATAAEPGGSPPASISRENDLVLISLKPEAENALRLQTAPVEKRVVPAVRSFPGEVVTPLAADTNRVAPVLGGSLEEVLRLADLQAAADGRILQAQVQIDGSRIAVERAQKMLSAEAGSMRGVDEAKNTLALAEAALKTAQAQRDILGSPVGKGGAKRTWVRTAISSGEATRLDQNASVSVKHLASNAPPNTASPVSGPPTANAIAGTIDWYYELTGAQSFRAGERVKVEIPLHGSTQEVLVIPYKAVLHDIHGGQWVYVRTTAHTYVRRRVQIARTSGNDAVLSSPLSADTMVVTDGSAELFGTEFVTGK
jgi:multidrug efflux system membrane fusion protein